MQIRPLDYRKGHSYFSFSFLSALPLERKRQSSKSRTDGTTFTFPLPPRRRALHPLNPAPPPSEVKAGPGRAGQRRPGASPGGARKLSCRLLGREDQPQLRAPGALRSTWRGVGAGAAAANLICAPLGKSSAVGSAETRPRERGKARAHRNRSDAARRLDRAGCGARKTKNFRRDVPAALAVRSQIHRPAPAERRTARATVDGRTDHSVRP